MAKKSKSRSSPKFPKSRKSNKGRGSSPPPESVANSKPVDSYLIQTTGFKMLDGNGYDDGGLADLQLIFDLEDTVQKKIFGVKYFNAQRADELPREKEGAVARLDRREQKLALAALLYQSEEKSHCVFVDCVDGQEDKKTIEYRTNRLNQAQNALRRSLYLQETACISISLSELCKRQLALEGKPGAMEALQHAKKALLLAGEGAWNGSDVKFEGQTIINKSNIPGLASKASLRLRPLRVSQLCLRQALVQHGNALMALGRKEAARAAYQQAIPLVVDEPRCARIDWECHSLHVNIGNTFDFKSGEFDLADKEYRLAEFLGVDHLQEEGGSSVDGHGMIDGARRARAFALNKAGRTDEAKVLVKDVLESQVRLEIENRKKEQEEVEAANKLNPEGASFFQSLLEEPTSSNMFVHAT